LQIQKLEEVLYKYSDIIQNYNCKRVHALATNAFRIASNSDQVIHQLNEKIGINIEIISGLREAELTFLGAYSATVSHGNKLLIDIGGGSTEIILGNKNEILFSKSFDVGVVSLTEKFIIDTPAEEKILLKMLEHVEHKFGDLSKVLPGQFEAIAVAGTPTTLSCLLQNRKEFDEEIVEGSEILQDQLFELYNSVKLKSNEQILNQFGNVTKGRDDLLLAGIIILKQIMQLAEIKRLTVSSKGLRYGILVEKYLR
ncbi:MAG: hypothetical protein K9I99_11340, partial [Melioribacteraceae bacterium]|nr:hypothetical protein [Melioribacteraceae bacterium]